MVTENNIEDNEDIIVPEEANESSADPDESSSEDPVDWKNLLKPDTSSLSEEARKRVFAMSASKNKPTYKKVEEAVSVIGTGDAGASIPAILTWIINNYPILDPSKLKVNVKRAVLKGLKGGRLVRTKTSKKAQGVSGSFTFPAQRIKLKAVRLEGKKYVFPILQPVSSNLSTAEGPSDVIKRRASVDEGKMSSPKRQSSTPRRLPKSKLVLSEGPNLNASEL